MNRKTISNVLIFAIVIVGIPLGWYLLSPLWINVEVSEDFPVVSTTTIEVTEQPTVVMPIEVQATDAMATAIVLPPMEMTEEMPEPEMVVLAQGNFYPIAHASAGTATIYQLADGSRILRLQNFSVDNGPDLQVYLTSENPIANTVGIELSNYVDLGNLKGNIGDQNYAIPTDLDLSTVHSVVIWCEPFRVPFSAAPLIGE
jgi:hypothetical protein